MADDSDPDMVGSLLSEQHLRHMARHVKELVPRQDDDSAIKIFQNTFEDVLYTAAAPVLSTTHRVAAWNSLCSLLDQGLDPHNAVFAVRLFDLGIWARSFTLYLVHSNLVKPKSSRQLLLSLTTTFMKCPLEPSVKGQIERSVVLRLLESLTQNNNDQLVKTAVSCLAHFLTKHVTSLDVLLDTSNSVVDDRDVRLQELFIKLFDLAQSGDFVSAICQLITVLLDEHDAIFKPQLDHHGRSSLWMAPLEGAFTNKAIDIPVLRVHVLPTLFKRSFQAYIEFLSRLGFGIKPSRRTDHEVNELLYASLLTGKDMGFILESDRPEIWSTGNALHVPVQSIVAFLHHASRDARLTGLALLIHSPAPTRPLISVALGALKRHLHHLMSDSDSNFRSEVFSLMQHMIDRFRFVTAALSRQAQSFTASISIRESHMVVDTLEPYQEFLQWLLRHVMWALRPTATYQRHISALKVLNIIARSGVDERINSKSLFKNAKREPHWTFHMRVISAEHRQLLLNLLVDPFDDVRRASADLLLLMSEGSSLGNIKDALARGERSMLATGRADYADGVAHLYTLLHKQSLPPAGTDGITCLPATNTLHTVVQMLETMLDVGRSDLSQAVTRYPLHGLLISIRYLILQDIATVSDDQGTRDRLYQCLSAVWDVVRPTLCDDAPEGYLPESMGDEQSVTTKDTLSYCWRALKESSSLLETLVTTPSKAEASVRVAELQSLSQLCFTQLAELRHRGAFSTVAQTWSACCIKTRDLVLQDKRTMLEKWYDATLQILRSGTTINTRRSAGLPSLLCGILVADPTDVMMEMAITDLDSIAREVVESSHTREGSLPQVHAMNCLKDILKNTRLGEHSERYIPLALRLTAHALRSEAWAVRNCGLMLFRAVIDRLLGTSEAHLEDGLQHSKRVSVANFSDLISTILSLVPATTVDSASARSVRNEGVFPALQLLQRLHVPDEYVELALKSSLALTCSHVWHIRDKAARTFASILSEDAMSRVLSHLNDVGSDQLNELHGALLCVKYLVERVHHELKSCSAETVILGRRDYSFIKLVISTLVTDAHYSRRFCPYIVATWFDIVNEVIKVAELYTLYDNHSRSEEAKFLNDISRIIADMSISPQDKSVAALGVHFARTLAMLYCRPTDIKDCLNAEAMISKILLLDEDAIIEFLRALDVERLFLLQDHTKVLADACWALLGTSRPSARLTCEVMRTMLEFMSRMTDAARLFVQPAGFVLLMHMSHELETPHVANMLLQLRGAYLELTASSEMIDINALEEWAYDCSTATSLSGMCSSEAAVSALGHLDHLWLVLSTTHDHAVLLRKLILTTYDLLNDDDEDVRIHASKIAHKISLHLSRLPCDLLVPAAASINIVKLLVLTWPTADDVIQSAFTRVFSSSLGDFVSVADRMVDLSSESTALFAEEKQNLYIDEASELRLWTAAIMKLAPQHISKALIWRLSQWVTRGLATLKEQLESQPDGPLSWTSKQEVFVLGLQLLYGVEILFHLAGHRIALPVRPSSLRRQLIEVSNLCKLRTDCGLWHREIDRILGGSVLSLLGRAKQLAGQFEVNTC